MKRAGACGRCGGEGAVDGDYGDVPCPSCHGSGDAAVLRPALVAAVCLTGALVGYYAPVMWWTS